VGVLVLSIRKHVYEVVMDDFARFIGWVFALLGVILIVMTVQHDEVPVIYGVAAGFGTIATAVVFFVLAGILENLVNINNRLTWLMPEEYFDANPDEKPKEME